MHTWDLTDLPHDKSTVGCKWVYKINTRCNGTMDYYKARLVAKRFTQGYGINYEEMFAHVACITSVHSLLALAAARRWNLFQMDVKNAFLHGNLAEEVYMKPPPDFIICLTKYADYTVYGVKQAPRVWFSKFSSTIGSLGFTSCPYDYALFQCSSLTDTNLVLLYVNDMIITCDDPDGIPKLKTYLHQ